MRVNEITKNQYNNFLSRYEMKHFLSGIEMAERRILAGSNAKFLGFFENDEMLGAVSLLEVGNFYGYKRYLVHMGPLIDYENLNLVKLIFKSFTNYINANKILNIIISPNVLYKKHYPLKEENQLSLNVMNILDGLKYKRLDDNISNNLYMRHFFIKDLTLFKGYQDIFKSFDNETKRIINNAKKTPYEIVELDKNNLYDAVEIINQTAERKKFIHNRIDYFETLYDVFNNKNENSSIKYLKVVIKVDKYKEMLSEDILNIEKKILEDEKIDSRRALNRIQQNKDMLNALTKKIDQLENMKDKEIDISSGIFIEYYDTITYFFGGNVEEYNMFSGAYLLQDYMLEYAINHGYKKYDFYGTRNSDLGYADEEGVFNFKKGFGGELIENIGFYEYMPKNLVNNTFKFLKKVKEKLS